MDWKKLIPWAVLALAAYLLGYVPQRSEVGRLRAEMTQVAAAAKKLDERVNVLQSKIRLAELRDLAGIIYLETSRKNFGIARQRSSQFFTLAAELAGEPNNANLKEHLDSLVAGRDAVTASLARADGSSQEVVLKLLESVHENLGKN